MKSPISSSRGNAPGAKTNGVEAEFEYAPLAVQALNIRGAINYNDAYYTNFTNAPCYGGQTIAQGCNAAFNARLGGFTQQDLSGVPLSMAAK